MTTSVGIGIIAVIYLVVAVILPTLKRKRCTDPVTARVTNPRLYYVNGVGRKKATMKYVYGGNPYVTDILIISSSMVSKNILVNPKKPREWVSDNKDSYYGFMILLLVIAVAAALILFVF